MDTVPNIISTKDLSYLEDIFEWNMNASKKAFHFAGEAQDVDVQNILEKCAKLHAGICHKIVEILGNGGQNGQ